MYSTVCNDTHTRKHTHRYKHMRMCIPIDIGMYSPLELMEVLHDLARSTSATITVTMGTHTHTHTQQCAILFSVGSILLIGLITSPPPHWPRIGVALALFA